MKHKGFIILGICIMILIYGDLNDLGQLLMFYGSREILRPDCERLVEMLSTVEGTYIEAYMGEEKLHDYVMIVEDPQSVLAFDRIAEFLKPDTNNKHQNQ